ncbi:VOC family protein [Actinomadura sediminis]|uniref:VOC family protein n=1 Tax=Actinomadura sediminis TaxID=1038904 RepID=A0ABW3F1J9_9ACTN
MLRGMANVSLWAEDLEAASRWYAELLGTEPYFSKAGPDGKVGYYEFRIGDRLDELGLIDARFAPPGHAAGRGAGPGGVVLSWHVDDLEGTLDRLLEMGATLHEGITARGDGGFVTASVVDPFGNVLGIMKNPHYLEVLERTGTVSRPAP